MGVLVYLIFIAVASFAVLAQPAVAQGANSTLTYPAQVLQRDGSQTFPSETQRERVRNQVKNATRDLLQGVITIIFLLWWVWLEACSLPQHV